MKDSFNTIDPERKKRILDAAFKEFARHGYERASTNRIVEEAGIGKGPLFSYFGSKHGLFEFLVEYANDYVNKFLSKVNDPEYESDFIEKYRVASRLKLERWLEEPQIFEFLAWLYLHTDEMTAVDGMKKFVDIIESTKKNFLGSLVMNHDISKFRTDIPAEKLTRYIGWTMDGYIQSITDRIRMYPNLSEVDLDPFWKEFDEIIDDLKKIFYDTERRKHIH